MLTMLLMPNASPIILLIPLLLPITTTQYTANTAYHTDDAAYVAYAGYATCVAHSAHAYSMILLMKSM